MKGSLEALSFRMAPRRRRAPHTSVTLEWQWDFTALVSEQSNLCLVWAFSKGDQGQLGLRTDAVQMLQALEGGADGVFDGEAIVIVAAERKHTACATEKGNFEPARARQQEDEAAPSAAGQGIYGGSPVVMVSCGEEHTLVLTLLGV